MANLPMYLGVAAGYPMVMTTTNVVAVAFIVPAIVVATRTFGVAGAAAVWVVLNSIYVVVAVPRVHRRVLRGELWRWYANDLLKPAVVAAAVAGAARLLMPDGLNAAGTIAYVGAAGVVTALVTAAVLPHVVTVVRNFIRGVREARA
jgi:hypothetical protein